MTNLRMLLFALVISIAHAEVMHLDEELLNKEIAIIMRSRGIEPELVKKRTMLARLGFVMKSPSTRSVSNLQHLFYRDHIKRNYLSMAELYNLAFHYLKIGRVYDAVEIWHLIALSTPTNQDEEGYVNAAMELSTINPGPNLYPFVRIPIRKISHDSSYIVMPPIAASALVASLLS